MDPSRRLQKPDTKPPTTESQMFPTVPEISAVGGISPYVRREQRRQAKNRKARFEEHLRLLENRPKQRMRMLINNHIYLHKIHHFTRTHNTKCVSHKFSFFVMIRTQLVASFLISVLISSSLSLFCSIDFSTSNSCVRPVIDFFSRDCNFRSTILCVIRCLDFLYGFGHCY